jgi:hypothetical protein
LKPVLKATLLTVTRGTEFVKVLDDVESVEPKRNPVIPMSEADRAARFADLRALEAILFLSGVAHDLRSPADSSLERFHASISASRKAILLSDTRIAFGKLLSALRSLQRVCRWIVRIRHTSAGGMRISDMRHLGAFPGGLNRWCAVPFRVAPCGMRAR